ncbi:MAG: hypothetical protein IKP06_00900 [Elusimicrobiaceae bacterium]|nr:hypothetical protein [Elusimicrobiaceae bacterium]
MNKWIQTVVVCLEVLIFGLLGFSCYAFNPDSEPIGGFGLSQAQQEFNTHVYSLLQEDKLDELQQFMGQVPNCPVLNEQGEKEVCTMDRTDGLRYILHVRKKFFANPSRPEIISIDRGFYDALSAWYRTLYNQDPRKLDAEKYRHFYRRYSKTALATKVEEIMIQAWQPGQAFDGTTWAGITYGKENYTALYVSWLTQFDDIYKHVSPRLYLYKYRAGASFVYLVGVFKEMEKLSQETNTPWLWNSIKSRWLDSLLEPESYHDSNYYEGRKQKLIIEFFNKEGWRLFMSGGYQPTKWQRHTATLYGRACERMTNLEPLACERYREGINLYGINEDLEKQQEIRETISRDVLFAWQNQEQ